MSTPTDEAKSSLETVIERHRIYSQQDEVDEPNNTYPTYMPHMMRTPLQTIVEVMNPMLGGDGTANEIIVGRSNDEDQTYSSIDDDGSFEYEYHVQQRMKPELSLNAKMKNVLQELVENEKVKRLSRSFDEDDFRIDEEEYDDVDRSDEIDGDSEKCDNESEKLTTREISSEVNGNRTVFYVREKLINDFYTFGQDDPSLDEKNGKIILSQDFDPNDNESILLSYGNDPAILVDNCAVFENPVFNVTEEEFLQEEAKAEAISEENEKIKEKLLSEMNIETNRSFIAAEKQASETALNDDVFVEDENNDDNDDEDVDNEKSQNELSSAQTTQTSNENTRKKKRKNRNKKKSK